MFVTNVGQRATSPGLAIRFKDAPEKAYEKYYPSLKDDSVEAPYEGFHGTQMGYRAVAESARFVDYLTGEGVEH